MAFTKTARPATNFSKTALPRRAVTARFGIAKFNQARFGASDSYTKVAKNNTNFAKVART